MGMYNYYLSVAIIVIIVQHSVMLLWFYIFIIDYCGAPSTLRLCVYCHIPLPSKQSNNSMDHALMIMLPT